MVATAPRRGRVSTDLEDFENSDLPDEHVVERSDGDDLINDVGLPKDEYAPLLARNKKHKALYAVEHDHPALTRMWKPRTRDNGEKPVDWIPVDIPNHMVREAVKNSFLLRCPRCGTKECEGDSDPNLCAGRQNPVFFAECPICERPFWDPDPDNLMLTEGPEAEHKLTLYKKNANPESRLRFAVDQHMLVCHKRESFLYGIKAPADGVAEGLAA